ncbi:hypothetical protein TTE0230 [Caldanaerobacter subterraneus subsp. tengcongensis MB4]|uniref:Uncharacterized protein n=1 Tax=Caldanaerobacter subterraneus subsp. tengcongensis (strain DSM 15242 / JCM 11007 / NBRC 100824 / MB4) TaxID=273068 RepID=Q8RD20_CALS4|nr:hypothetical protein TTE0230 [Caldanaerobacter subterraneus subsp. tengcongensis MB4]
MYEKILGHIDCFDYGSLSYVCGLFWKTNSACAEYSIKRRNKEGSCITWRMGI